MLMLMLMLMRCTGYQAPAFLCWVVQMFEKELSELRLSSTQLAADRCVLCAFVLFLCPSHQRVRGLPVAGCGLRRSPR